MLTCYKKYKVKPSGSWCLRLSELLDNRHMKVIRLSALRTGHRYSMKYSWYSFLSEADSTLQPQRGRKDQANEKFQ